MCMCARASLSLSLSLCGCVRAHVRVSLSLTVTFSLPLPPPPSLSVCVCVCVRQHGCTCACACVWGGAPLSSPGPRSLAPAGPPVAAGATLPPSHGAPESHPSSVGSADDRWATRTVRQPDSAPGPRWHRVGHNWRAQRAVTSLDTTLRSPLFHRWAFEAILSLARLIRRAVSLHRSTAAHRAFLRPFLSPPPTPPV